MMDSHVLAAEAEALDPGEAFVRTLGRSMRHTVQAIRQLRLKMDGGIGAPRSKGWRKHLRRTKAAERG